MAMMSINFSTKEAVKILICSALFCAFLNRPAAALTILPCEAGFEKMLHKAQAVFLGQFKELRNAEGAYDGIAVFEPTKIWRGTVSNPVSVAYVIPDYLNEKDKEKYLQRFDKGEEYLLMIKGHEPTSTGQLLIP